jgi:hypothetical protein
VTSARIDPSLLVILLVIHHSQYVNPARSKILYIEDPTDQSEAIVPDVEHDTVFHLVRRPKGLLQFSKIHPLSVFCYLVPGRQVSFGAVTIISSALPKFFQPTKRNDAHEPPCPLTPPYSRKIAAN